MYSVVIGQMEAIKLIAQSNGLPAQNSPDALIDQVIAEYLRKALCSLTTINGGPVYITQLTNAVRRQLAPIWPELYSFRERSPSLEEQQVEGDSHPDRVRRVLELLSDLRDVVELGGGYWLPAPVRLVALPGQDHVLAVGGLATADLRKALCPEIGLVGFARVIGAQAIAEALRDDRSLWQPYRSWCGDGPVDLKAWTEGCIDQAKRDLRMSASSFTSFEVYAPWLRRKQPQYFRWMRFDDFHEEVGVPPVELLLCRTLPQRLQMPRHYWLGLISDAGLKNEVPLTSGHARRLAYGMDLLCGAPTQAVWDGDILVLRNGLPPEEQRPLMAIGRDLSPQPGRLPIRLLIDPEWRDFVNERLLGLGIKTVSR